MPKGEIVQDENTQYVTVRPPLLTYHSATCDLPSLRNLSAEICILFLLLYLKLNKSNASLPEFHAHAFSDQEFSILVRPPNFVTSDFVLFTSLVHCEVDMVQRWSLIGFILQILCLTTDKSPLHTYVCQFRLIRNSHVLNILQLIAGLVPTLVQ